MNSTCIQYEGSRPEYIHVQELANMHKTPYTMGKIQRVHIHLTLENDQRNARVPTPENTHYNAFREDKPPT
jgi:hypothetical protein